jgi:exodeoxyribonuclease V gamma subunit
MPLHLHLRLTLPALADVAADLLRTAPPGDDPFAPDVLVVGGRGVEQWLRLALIERLDIVTNLQVWSPSRFLQDLEQWAVPSARGGAAALTVDILEAVAADRALLPPELQHLAGEAGAESVDGLLASWAGRMARTFERYLMYRHALLLEWERGGAPADWQANLWRAVTQRPNAEQARTALARSAHARSALAPAARQLRARQLIEAGAAQSAHDGASLSPRWLVLQQGRLAPAHLALVRSLSARHDVHLLVHAATTALRDALVQPLAQPAAPPDAPHRDRRGEVLARQHAVATRLDRVRADALLAARPVLGVPASATAHEPTAAEPAQPSAPTPSDRSLLAAVQHALREEAGAATASWRPDPARDDRSLRVLACHGALRQVEVLKDALLGAFNDDPTLQPRDVLVLTPDPARFVPLVQAVFPLGRDAREGAPPLALHVQGRSPRATNPVADVLLTLLTLAEQRVSASRVLDLLERGPVAERFGIKASDAPLVREWLHAAGVRWGIDATDPMRAGLGLGDEGTWRRGLARLLVGAAVLDGGQGHDTHVRTFAPVPGLEGERVLLAGRTARAVRQLLELLDAARAPRSLDEWSAFADTVLDRLVATDGAFASSVPRVRDVLATFTEESAGDVDRRGRAQRIAPGSPYAASAVASLLENRLEDVLGSPGRLGGITVAPLGTGWVRPARVIALLGMDDELFPRRGGTPWFDRLGEHPEPGDPDDRGEQLQTVFEAVMLAGDQLLVTYTGWNRAGTMRLPPSVAVSALDDAVRDVVAPNASDATESAWHEHVEREMPLQPFSARAFATADRAATLVAPAVPSFDVLAAATATRLRRKDTAHGLRTSRDVAEASHLRRREMLPLVTLLRFLRRPAEEILSRLGIRLAEDSLLLEDVLPLTVSRLDESAIVRDMAESLLQGGVLDGQFDALRHRDRMPPAQLGRAWAHDAEQRARALASRAPAAVHDLPRREREVLRVTVGDTVLTGTIDMRHGDRLLFMRDGRHQAPQLVSPLATLCFAAAAGATVQDAVQVDGDTTTLLTLPADPLAVLHDLVSLYHDAERAVPPYVPATSYAYQEAIVKEKGEEQAREAARTAWDPDNPQARGECEEPANELLHQASPIDAPDFATFAKAVFGPVIAAQGAA